MHLTRRQIGKGALATLTPTSTRANPRLTPVVVDHHVHLHSPAMLAFLPDYCEAVSRFGKCDPAFTSPLTPGDLLAQMDAAGVKRSLVLSTGYLAESPMISPRRADAAQLLRAANDWTVALALRTPRRFRALVALEPRASSALPEIAHWRSRPGVAGVKIHLTSSGLNLRSDEDTTVLASVFQAAAQARLAIVIHLRTQVMDYGAQDMQRFIDEVLPSAGGAPVQIAHAGGWGGVDKQTLAALEAFAVAYNAKPASFQHVWFDLAGVWTDATLTTDMIALVSLIRRIGARRFLPGSDWPFAKDLVDYYGRIYPALPLTQDEWATIRSNVAPHARD